MQQYKCLTGAIGLCAAFCLMALSVQAEATIYRWVSPDGVASYGSNPPANARHVETLDGLPVSPAQSAAPAEAAPVTPPAMREKQAPTGPTQEHQALQTELAAARLQLLQAMQAYEKGKAVRYGNERNYARYLERINSLKQAVHDAQLRVLLLERQLQQTSPSNGSNAQ
ncbi:DUF4124 domain-containing protein [Acidithiobacillus sp.]|uniref:DUF4124 domain-containing protein n=1 Tax=Acidithiobacillus sp. TaxID=1872118 RepID=UPI0032AFF23C